MLPTRILLLLALLSLAAAGEAPGDAAPLLDGLCAEQRPARLDALAAIGRSRDARATAFLDDYRQGSAFRWSGRVVLVPEVTDGAGIPLDPLARTALGPAVREADLATLEVGRPERLAAVRAATRLRLTHPDPGVRLAAAIKAGDAGGADEREALAAVAGGEDDPRVRRAIDEGLAMADLADSRPQARTAAAVLLGGMQSSRALDRLRALAADQAQPGEVRGAAARAAARIEARQQRLRAVQTAFSGVSAGSILVLMALGLAITFGLMGVINMAHGEMLMLGAYATLLVQWGFDRLLPAAAGPWYFAAAVPAAFLAAGAAGWLLELTVIRHLYGRPLETLLATWGISYLLVQGVRTAFGDNQAVTAPPWLVGGWEPVDGLVLPWNRLFIIALTIASVAAVVALMRGTRLGLLLRATVQSRRTAASLGVDTRRIDGLTFALGSGLAGAAGCAITLIGGLKPDMGQEYIIDSFLVVATGGVGNLAGVCCAGLGLGLLNKALEPFTQAVYAKVLVLAAVILFLQWRSQGLFPPRGRLADG